MAKKKTKAKAAGKATKTNTATAKTIDMFKVAAVFFVMWSMIVNPLWLEDQYFNQTAAKGHALIAGISITFVLILIAAVSKQTIQPLKPRKNVTDISIVVFGVTAVISSVLSEYNIESMLGYRGWWIGGFQMLSFAILVILLSHRVEWSKMICATIMTVGFLIFFMDILHSVGIDFLYLHRDMLEGEVNSYLATIGNIDWQIGFISLTMPILAILYLKNEDKEWDILYRVYLFMACVGMVLIKTDGLYAGLGVCAFFAVPFVCSKAKYIERFLHIVGFFGIATLIVVYIPWFAITKQTVGGVAAVFVKPLVAWAFTILGAAGTVALRKFGNSYTPRIAKIVTIACELALAAVAIYFVIDMFTTFDDAWGSGRGMIWKFNLEYFAGMPFFNKLIGMGPETLLYYNSDLHAMYGMYVLTNHSDFLQFIITNGIIGCGAWIVMWISIIVRQLKHGSMNSDAFPFFIALMAYLGQSTVFTAEGMDWPLLISVMGLYLFYQYREEN